jgi:type II secretory pathway pseudopilin PulG
MYTVVILLIAIVIIAGISASAVQQHKERKETQKREEVSRQRAIINETDNALTAARQMPVSQQLIAIISSRIHNSLKKSLQQSPNPNLKQRLSDTTNSIKSIDISQPTPDHSTFKLPDNDKAIIKYIQAVKRLRVILRSEHGKGNITAKVFSTEDKNLERLQLRVNVETLNKRACDALGANMQGSARQYLEKAVNAMKAHKPQDDYTTARTADLEAILIDLAEAMKQSNLEQIAVEKDKEKDSDDIDQLFGPKKKW